jgi:hypothetical protein
METVTAGLAMFDYDNDGDTDIYFLNGSPLGKNVSTAASRNALYRNDGNWKFTDVTETSGVGDTGYGLGVAVADYDNDGDADIYLNNFGANVLYRNEGNGTFTDVTKQAGVDNGNAFGAGACFFDMEGDGDLDLYVARYVKFSYDKHITSSADGYPTYSNPHNYPPMPDTLYRNNGDGTFTDVSKESGIADHAGWGMGTVCADFDNDGDTDVFVANDVAENFLFQNDGNGKFEETALIAGFAYDLNGNAHGSMGVDCGDYDNDGLIDFYVTSYQQQFATLYRNSGDGLFEDVTAQTGAGTGTLPKVTWGNGLTDFDNDGDRDIFIACGHLQDNVDLYDDVSSYLETNIILENDGSGKFKDVSAHSGSGMKVKLSSRAAGFDDLDNDGDIDVVVLNSRSEPTVLRNDSTGKGHWVQLKLAGTKANKDAVGGTVKLTSGDLTLIDEVHSGRGYQSHYGTTLHFGIGKNTKVDRIEVRWIGGNTDVFENISADKRIILTEGAGEK